MLNIPYKVIDDKDTRNLFDKYLDVLNIPLIDYVAIGMQDHVEKISYSLKSDSSFQKIFNEMELATHDPIRQAIWNTNYNFIDFSHVNYKDKMSKVVMDYRMKLNHSRGFIYIQREKTKSYSLTLTTSYQKFDSYKYFLENQLPISLIIGDLIKIINR